MCSYTDLLDCFSFLDHGVAAGSTRELFLYPPMLLFKLIHSPSMANLSLSASFKAAKQLLLKSYILYYTQNKPLIPRGYDIKIIFWKTFNSRPWGLVTKASYLIWVNQSMAFYGDKFSPVIGIGYNFCELLNLIKVSIFCQTSPRPTDSPPRQIIKRLTIFGRCFMAPLVYPAQ